VVESESIIRPPTSGQARKFSVSIQVCMIKLMNTLSMLFCRNLWLRLTMIYIYIYIYVFLISSSLDDMIIFYFFFRNLRSESFQVNMILFGRMIIGTNTSFLNRKLILR
jgi:hypothetical protein